LNVVSNSTDVVSVKIFAADVLLHEQTVEVNGNFGLVYNLAQVRAKTDAAITFVVTTKDGKTQTVQF